MSLPLTLPVYILDPTASVQVTIVSNYTTAQVVFLSGSTTVYSLTLIQQATTQQLPPDLQIGDFKIISGTLKLQLPSAIQTGTVTLDCQFTDTNVTTPQPLNAVVASWNLNQ